MGKPEASQWCARLNQIKPFSSAMRYMEERRGEHPIFAKCFAEGLQSAAESEIEPWMSRIDFALGDEADVAVEFERLGFDENAWQISDLNHKFEICKTYPRKLIIPKCVTEKLIKDVVSDRIIARIPAVVWYNKENDSVLMRSSQPNWKISIRPTASDIELLNLMRSSSGVPGQTSTKQMMLLDCREYSAAYFNFLRGGGAENIVFYNPAFVQFAGIPNIHGIKSSFNAMCTALSAKTSPADAKVDVLGSLWLNHLALLIKTAQDCARALTFRGESVLVHCSDGWDRTAQITTLTKIIVDPYYRTIEGFEYLIRRDWIDFGHKFADRNGYIKTNESSPIFLQWLDCVYQLYYYLSSGFEFSAEYLVKLAEHAYSGLFGTFLWNNVKHRSDTLKKYPTKLVPVWSFLDKNDERFKNPHYKRTDEIKMFLMSLSPLDMNIWVDVYKGSLTEQKATILYPKKGSSQGFIWSIISRKKKESRKHYARSHSADGNLSPNDSQSSIAEPRSLAFHKYKAAVKDFLDADGLVKISKQKKRADQQKWKNDLESKYGELDESIKLVGEGESIQVGEERSLDASQIEIVRKSECLDDSFDSPTSSMWYVDGCHEYVHTMMECNASDEGVDEFEHCYENIIPASKGPEFANFVNGGSCEALTKCNSQAEILAVRQKCSIEDYKTDSSLHAAPASSAENKAFG